MWSELLSAPLSFRCHIVDIELDVLTDVLVFHLWVQLLMRVLVVTLVALQDCALLSANLVTEGLVLLLIPLKSTVLWVILLVRL